MHGTKRGMTIDGAITMTLGETLRQYVREPRTQKEIALTWFEVMRQLGRKWSSAHVESQPSRCFNDHLPAVRFFFGEREQGRALLKALEVPEPEFGRLLELADETLTRNGARSARLIIDLTPWAGSIESKKLFEALRTSIIEPQPLKPAVLLVTRSQYDDLPRSFDEEDEWLEVRRVEGPLDVEQLDANALIASPNPQKDVERWLAMGLDPSKRALLFEPSDGLTRFGQYGKLSLPPIAFALADYVDASALPAPRVPGGPIERRRWMEQLRTEAAAVKVDPDPRMRLAIARSLGIDAVATEQDKIEHELAMAAARLAITNPKVGSVKELDALLHRAGRYPIEETVLRVNNELHVVNPLPERNLEGVRVRVHRVTSKTPAIRQLLAAVENWTIGDYDADPFLLRVIEQLGTNPEEHLALLHARTTLVRSKALHPKPGSPVEDWRGALRKILQLDPPRTLLRVSNASYADTSPMPAWMTAALHNLNLGEEDANILRFTPSPLEEAVVERDQALSTVFEDQSNYNYYSRRINFVLVESQPVDGQRRIDDEQWLDAFDTLIGKPNSNSGVRPIKLKAQDTLSGLWADADHQAALLWLALRGAVSAPAVRRQDGTIVLRLGRGLGITVRASETAQLMPPAVILAADGKDRAESMNLVDTGLRRGDYEKINVWVPKGITLHHERTRLEIGVVASPLLGLALSAGVAIDDDHDDNLDDDDD